LQVGNTHATRKAILFKNLHYILREIYDILSEDALNYLVKPWQSCCASTTTFSAAETMTWAWHEPSIRRYRWLWGQFLSGNPCAGWGRGRRSTDKSEIFCTAAS